MAGRPGTKRPKDQKIKGPRDRRQTEAKTESRNISPAASMKMKRPSVQASGSNDCRGFSMLQASKRPYKRPLKRPRGGRDQGTKGSEGRIWSDMVAYGRIWSHGRMRRVRM